MDERNLKSDDLYKHSRLSPWLELWLRPRQVTRRFLNSTEPLKNAWLLVVIAGVLNGFNTASGSNWGDDLSLPALVAGAIITGVVSAVISYYVASFLVRWVGSWLGGEATTQDIRVVIGQISSRANILLGLLLIPKLLIAGSELFTTSTPNLHANLTLHSWFSVISFMEFIVGILLFIIMLHAVGEAHKFSAGKALVVELILIAAAVIIGIGIVLIAS